MPTDPRRIKKYVLKLQGHVCAKCDVAKWNNTDLVLELEHKDGNSSNNLLANLECLCPNCHSQTATYKSKNIGFGRKSRRKASMKVLPG